MMHASRNDLLGFAGTYPRKSGIHLGGLNPGKACSCSRTACQLNVGACLLSLGNSCFGSGEASALRYAAEGWVATIYGHAGEVRHTARSAAALAECRGA